MPMGASPRVSPSSFGRPNSDDSESDFEFSLSQVYYDEPPLSPKLYMFSPVWESAASSLASTPHSPAAHVYMDAPNIHYLNVMDASQQDLDGTLAGSASKKSLHRYCGDGVIGENQHLSSRDKDCLIEAPAGGVEAPAIYSSLNEINGRKGSYLRSLMLERRELEQLPRLQGYHQEDSTANRCIINHMILRSSPSPPSSDASSPESPSSASSTLTSTQHHIEKSRRWSFKWDFLQAKKEIDSPSNAAHYNMQKHAPSQIDGRHCTNYHHASESNHHDFAKMESRRKSTSSIGSASSATKREREVLRGEAKSMSMSTSKSKSKSKGKGKGKSCPVSPAASPSRATVSSPTKGSTRPPVSPVKSPYHYQLLQQRGRAEELRRRTFLPYRPLLFGACFVYPQVAC